MSIRVVNLKSYSKVEGEVLIKVDRSSVLGNPFRMRGNSDCERDRVCDSYERYFNAKVKVKGSAFRNEVVRIYRLAKAGNNIALGCWCAPKRCHAEYIKAFIEKWLPDPEVKVSPADADKNLAFIKEESKGSSSTLCNIVIRDGSVKKTLHYNLAKSDAIAFCENHNYVYCDCHEFLWDLEIEEASK